MLRLARISSWIALAAALGASPLSAQSAEVAAAGRQLYAEVVAIDQVILLNRLGAALPQGMMFVLKSDVVPSDCYSGGRDCTSSPHPPFDLKAGQVILRRDKRPRPIVLRANRGDTLTIRFWNLLNPNTAALPGAGLLPATRTASMHLMGMEWTRSSADDGSMAGANASSLASPAVAGTASVAPTIYSLHARGEGSFLLYSQAAQMGGYAGLVDGAQLASGLFGAINVEPAGARYYRSQVTKQDLDYATTGWTADRHPIIDYEAKYPPGAGDRAGTPVLNMLDAKYNLVATDLTAIIAAPFTPPPPKNYAEPARNRAYREFTIHYHEANDAVQAFPEFYGFNSNPTLKEVAANPAPDWGLANVLNAGQDNFAINYGTGAIGAEVLANRLGVGPEGGCADCKFEEFFLSSWAVGDPAEVVEWPGTADSRCTTSQLTAATLKITTRPCIVDAGTVDSNGYMHQKRKAKRALYPDDPSNVYHSYINDHVKFRILHGGSVNTHVHHQHAHQWLHTENSNESTYLDSQMITMGAAYTLDIAYNGGGNRNKTVGDSIFHCHFYPHFAAGMWSLWRTHDVFEGGTVVTKRDSDPQPEWNRALPDGEIAIGTPIPALVPLPDVPMAPIPARVKLVPVVDPSANLTVGYTTAVHPDDIRKGLNPGFPFFIPGVGGLRAPHPPMDFAVDEKADGTKQTLDGGLPRHIIFSGAITNEKHNRWDFSKDLKNVNAMRLPEEGTSLEKVAMDFHAVCFHDSFFPNGTKGRFRTNGLPPASGAPFADPALDPAFENANREDICTNNRAHALSKNKIRQYRAAVFQTDLVLNKIGWHFPQSRMLSLWEDVRPTLGSPGQVPRPPQPFFFRANSGEAVEYWHTNLVPDYYLLDDYQVRTPTDVIGQHIHLVKFDVTSSDGAANGFNYEDGTFSPDEVRGRITDMNECGGLLQLTFDPANPYANLPPCKGGAADRTQPAPTPPPQEICAGTPGPEAIVTPCPAEWTGAQTTVQRWFADPLLNADKGSDRTIRTVFTHDHMGPSTHQQTGLYAALVVEPTNSKWYDNESGVQLGAGLRKDGGPTTWQAVIETPRKEGQTDANTYREFAIALADTQLAYTKDSPAKAMTQTYSPDNPTWAGASYVAGTTQPVINPAGPCPGGVDPTLGPCPTLISSGGTTATMSVNYRNEPLPARVARSGEAFPPATSPSPAPLPAPLPPENDLSYVFASIMRSNPQLNTQPTPGTPIGTSGVRYPPPLTEGLTGPDPYTAMLRAYEGDNVQIRLIAGAHVLPHTFGVNGVKWLFEPGTPADPTSKNNSGWKNLQAIGISEHYEFLFRMPRTPGGPPGSKDFTDYLYRADQNTSAPGLSDGMWGLLRSYRSPQSNLRLLSSNKTPKPLPPSTSKAGYSCPPGAPIARHYRITAVPASQAVRPGFTIVLNSRGPVPITTNQTVGGRTYPTGLLYVNSEDLDAYGVLKPGVPIEPLIIRANAGECVQIDLTNGFDLTNATTAQLFQLPKTLSPFNSVTMYPSTYAGLNAQVMAYDATTSNGQPVGYNTPQIAAPKTASSPAQTVTYYWYAGSLRWNKDGTLASSTAIELGGMNLMPSDPLFQNTQGLVAAMVVEPPNTTHCLDWWSTTSASASSRASARIYPGAIKCPPLSATMPKPLFHEFVSIQQDDLLNSYGAATNDAINYRTEPILFRYGQPSANQAFLFSNDISCAVSNALVGSDPQTPVFQARKAQPMRMRMLHPGGSGNEQVMTLHGHAWQEEPYTANSARIGSNPESNWLGSRDEHGPNDRFELVAQAGGTFGVTGDYLYHTYPAADFQGGLWGLVRVCDTLPCKPPATLSCPPGSATATSYAPASAGPDPTSKPAQRAEEFRKRGQNEKLPTQTPQPPPPQP
jgi:hypothetical protein